MTQEAECGILLSREGSWNYINPIDKGKPFERMGRKALEPKGLKGLMVVSCQKGDKVLI